ncbi:MAG: DUF1028 domain-containing protein [Acidobacteriota bacterium]
MPRHPTRPTLAAFLVLATLGASAPAHATWSILAVDTETQEVAIGAATCVTGIDLKAFLPVVKVGIGGGAAQFFIDGSGERRQIIHDGLVGGSTAEQIIAQLEALPSTANHQHGVAEAGATADAGSSATQTGANAGAWAGGNSGRLGSVYYAIAGNLLTGPQVVDMATQTFIDTPGDLPAKLMAAMETARAFGGDGRCSCSQADPDGCGAPPASFEKSSDVGFLIVARFGDTDDAACTAGGCADGDYFLDFNVANQTAVDPDAVLQLQTLFDSFRTGSLGRPDAIASTVGFSRTPSGFRMVVALEDWQGTSIGSGVGSFSVVHAADSDGITLINPPTDNGDGTYTVELDWDGSPGTDAFRITADDGVRPVVLPPRRASLSLDQIFADGFESGDTSGWS